MKLTKAVFISYAREDLAAARRIADALAAFDVQVWVDESELQGGEAWDDNIRAQIKTCALFVPIISANTQARREAYFRLEWKLAEERTHLMAAGTSFLLPIAIDDVLEDEALVPASFLRAQWMRLSRGVPNTNFVDHVRALLSEQPPTRTRAAPPALSTRQMRRRWAWVAGALALIGGIVLFARRTGSGPADSTLASATVPEKSIAVLPFVNLSSASENAFFTDGIHEDILTTLANVSALKVISRTSVVQYRDTQKPLRQIAAELGVRYVLEGSVQRAGNKVRVTAQLIDARSDTHIWASKYDEEFELTDEFTIQSALATEIAVALNAQIAPQEQTRLASRPTANVAAYDLYLKGREQSRVEDNSRDWLAKTEPLFAKAVELDPSFALAWAELASVHLKAYNTLDHSAARLAQSKECIDTAVRFAPEDPRVIMELGEYFVATNDLKTAKSCFERVVQAFPNSSDAFAGLGAIDRRDGHIEQALAEVRQAVSLDPRSRSAEQQLEGLLLSLRRYGELMERQKLWVDLGGPGDLLVQASVAMLPFTINGSKDAGDALIAGLPPAALRTDHDAIIVAANWAFITGNAPALVQLWTNAGPNWRFSPVFERLDLLSVAMAFMKLGQPERARPLLLKNRDLLVAALAVQPENTVKQDDLALTEAILGEKEVARKQLAKIEESAIGAERQVDLACAYAWLGDKDRAIALVARALKHPLPSFDSVGILRSSINWWPIQGDPGFEALVNDPKNSAPLF